MTRAFILSLLAASGLTACTQTVAMPVTKMKSIKANASEDVSKTNAADSDDEMASQAAEASRDYWLKYGLSGLYDGAGQWRRILQNAGPHQIFETRGDYVRISDADDNWVRRIDLSETPPEMRPILKTGVPSRPVITFPNILEDKAGRRGIDMKKVEP